MLLDTAAAIGLSDTEFWGLSLREFNRIAKARHKQEKAEQRERWQQTAMVCSYVANMAGKVLKSDIKASDLIDQWLGGTSSIEERLARLKRADEKHEARLKREKAKRANKAS